MDVVGQRDAWLSKVWFDQVIANKDGYVSQMPRLKRFVSFIMTLVKSSPWGTSVPSLACIHFIFCENEKYDFKHGRRNECFLHKFCICIEFLFFGFSQTKTFFCRNNNIGIETWMERNWKIQTRAVVVSLPPFKTFQTKHQGQKDMKSGPWWSLTIFLRIWVRERIGKSRLYRELHR